MKSKTLSIILIIIVLCLSGYIVFDKMIDKENAEIKKDKEKQLENVGSLTSEELYDVQQFLTTSSAQDFLKVYFKKPSEINMNQVLKYNSMRSLEQAKGDRKYYCEVMKLDTCDGEVPFEGDISLYKKETIEDYFKDYTGETIEVLKKSLLPKYYSEKDEAYFNVSSDAYESTIYVLSGTKNKNLYYVNYLGTAFEDDESTIKPIERKVVLKKSGGSRYGYYFVSNKKLD